jgi:hypothetical protein
VTTREIGEGGSSGPEGPPSARLSRWCRMIWQSPLRGHVKFVALAVALCCEPGEECCSPSVRELVGLVNMGHRTLVDALAELESSGFIQVDRDPEYVNEYALVFPTEAA